MAYVRRRKTVTKTKATTAKKARVPKTYEIDGFVYRTRVLRDYHEALSKNKYVKSFSLPTVGNEQEARVKRFGAFKVTINDILFDSIMESKFYVYLLELKGSKEIKTFERQVTFELQPKFKDKFSGKTVLPIKYISDFVVTDKDGTVFVVDVKGVETPEFRIKKKLFQYKYPNIQFMCLQWSARQKEWLDLDEIKKLKKSRKKK